MKIKLELFGASRDFSNKDHLEFNIKNSLEIKDFRKEIINYLDKNFKCRIASLRNALARCCGCNTLIRSKIL